MFGMNFRVTLILAIKSINLINPQIFAYFEKYYEITPPDAIRTSKCFADSLCRAAN